MDYILITPNVDSFANPTLVSIFETVQRDNGRVHLFGPAQQAACPAHIHCVEQHVCDFRLQPWRNPKRYWSQWCSYHLMAKYVKALGVKTAMVVDPMGVIIGGRLCKYFCKGLQLSYLSFEIFFRDELKGYYLTLKDKEIYYSRYITSVLSQDENRLHLLCSENHINLSNQSNLSEQPKCVSHFLVPVSTAPMHITSLVDIHTRFNIPKDVKTVVYSGSIGTWCGTDAILDMFEQGLWPKGHHLVFHTRKRIAVVKNGYDRLRKVMKGDAVKSVNEGESRLKSVNIGERSVEERLMALDEDPKVPFTLHGNPFDSFNDLGAFLKGFDIALALYYPNNESAYYGRNMQEIGLSSGKFSMYMMLGLPTIVTPCKTYEQLLKQYRFGAVLSDERQIAECLMRIDANCGKEAKRLYDEILQPNVEDYIISLNHNPS